MITPAAVKKLALALENTQEQPHFEVASFRVHGKIFLTLNARENRATVKLNPVDQSVFCSYDSSIVYAVPNAWGKQGWTNINLKKVRVDLFNDLLKTSYETVLKTIPQPKIKKEIMDQRLTFITLGVHDL